jgi:cytochrome c2
MKKIFRILGYSLLFLIICIAFLLAYVKTELPKVGEAENLKIERTPTRLARGEYLANCVTVCMDCHSTRDWNKFSGPPVKGTLGKGGETFDQKFGFPGSFYSKNITPAGIGNWTDGELLRAISSGVTKNGKAIFPVMPHANYGKMDKEDLFSIIAYLRTLNPIENNVKDAEPDFPMNIIINTIPKKAQFSKMPDKTNVLAYGAYLFNAAACAECHTKQDKGKPIAGMELAGGFEFPLSSGGIVRSTNITPDKETGIGTWTEEAFINRFKPYADSSYKPHSIAKGTFNTIMPWSMYGKMKEEDLKAIFAYLKTVKAIRNNVTKFTN